MIDRKVIEEIYRRYRKPPKDLKKLEVALLYDRALKPLRLEVDSRRIVVGALPEDSPLHEIPLERINGILAFESDVAIVLRSSILFLSREGKGARLHVKENPVTLWQKLRWWLRK